MKQKHLPESAGEAPATHQHPQTWQPAGVQSKPEQIHMPAEMTAMHNGTHPGCCPSPLPNPNDR